MTPIFILEHLSDYIDERKDHFGYNESKNKK